MVSSEQLVGNGLAALAAIDSNSVLERPDRYRFACLV
jgi:hypothetical protein